MRYNPGNSFDLVHSRCFWANHGHRTALRTAPTPIFDNLEYLGNPFQRKPEIPAGNSHIGAASNIGKDFELAAKFLYSYNGSSATFNSYRREIERLLQWAWHVRQVSILQLKREDIEDFIRFCQNPPVAWIGTKNCSRFLNNHGQRQPNKSWRPFVVSVSKAQFRDGHRPDKKQFLPSQAAIKATFTALSSLYDFLMQESALIVGDCLEGSRYTVRAMHGNKHRTM